MGFYLLQMGDIQQMPWEVPFFLFSVVGVKQKDFKWYGVKCFSSLSIIA